MYFLRGSFSFEMYVDSYECSLILFLCHIKVIKQIIFLWMETYEYKGIVV